MERNYASLWIILILLNVAGVFSLPKPRKPICTSYGGLCDVSFEISENDPLIGQSKYKSSSQMCECPGNTKCPRNSKDPAQVLYQEMSSPGQKITTKLSYCGKKSIPARTCSQNEVAVTLRGVGPIIMDIVGDMTCKCPGPLVLQRAYPDGIYSVREYACGKPTCNINRSTPPVCERVSRSLSMFGFVTESEIPCQCPDGFVCNTNYPVTQESMFDQTTEFRCEIERV